MTIIDYFPSHFPRHTVVEFLLTFKPITAPVNVIVGHQERSVTVQVVTVTCRHLTDNWTGVL